MFRRQFIVVVLEQAVERQLQNLEMRPSRRAPRTLRVLSLHGQPLSGRYAPQPLRASRREVARPAPRPRRHAPRYPWAAVRSQPLQHLEVAAQRRVRARIHVPRTAVLARPSLQHLWKSSRFATCAASAGTLVPRAVRLVRARATSELKVAALRRERARPLVPRAVLEHLGVTFARRARARIHAPRASSAHFQHLEVAFARCVRARLLVPLAAVLARPLQHLEVAYARRERARPLVPRAAISARPLENLGGRPPPRARTSTRPTANSPLETTSTPRAVRSCAPLQHTGDARPSDDLVDADT